MSADQLGSMEAEALKRKERLQALKNSAKSRQDSATDPAGSDATKKPKFRSYRPQDESILESAIAIPEPEPVDLQAAVQSQLDLLQAPIVIDEIGIANLAPRKPDWDLKRDVAKKLERLELRTQRAIAELIRDRLRAAGGAEGGGLPMLEAVNVAAAEVARSKLVLAQEEAEAEAEG